MTKLFGTDGIRGVVNTIITPQLAFDVGRALGKYISLTNNGRVVVGRDTRTSGGMLQCAIVAGITSQGVDCDVVDLCNTPGIAYLTQYLGYDIGVMITASHNLPEYNGIKFFDKSGLKLDNYKEDIIENILCNLDEYNYVNYSTIGQVCYKPQLVNKYISFLKKQIKKVPSNICIDCANGATSKIVQKLFKDNEQLFFINRDLNGQKINVKCGATDLDCVKDYVRKNNLQLGIAFDGDGDRIMLVDSNQVYDGDDILYALAIYYNVSTVVGTIMSNFGLEKSLAINGVDLIRVDVGDKNVIQEMIKGNYIIGGEQAGHIIQGNLSLTGDGILTLITIFNMGIENFIKQCKNNKKYPQELVNVKVKDKNIINCSKFKQYLDICESMLMEDGRIVVRPSGTEPVIRIMVEGNNKELIKKLAFDIEKFLLKL